MFLPVRLRSFFLVRVLAIALRRLTSIALALIFGITSLVIWPQPAQAQLTPFLPITAIDAPLVPTVPAPPVTVEFADPCDGGTFPGCAGQDVNLIFGQGGNRVLQSIEAGGLPLTRVPNLAEEVLFRRNPAGAVERDVLFFENAPPNVGRPPDLELSPELAAQIPQALLSPVVNRGVDNIFNNVEVGAQDTRNNIERIDYIIREPNGIEVPANQLDTSGFVILERVGGVADVVGIAAITALDAQGNPSAYGPLIRVGQNLANWGTTNEVEYPTIVFRRDDLVNEPNLRPSHRVPQQRVGGIFFPVSSLLDTPPNTPQRVFGYSLVAGDVITPGGNDLVDWLNTIIFPITSTGDSASGGLDLVAGGFGLFQVPQPPPPPPGNLFINKRITELTVSGTATPLTEVQNGADDGMPELVNAGLGQGALNVTNVQLQPGDEIEYTLYFNNTLTGTVTDVVVCDAIPGGTTFIPDTFGAGSGLQLVQPQAPQAPPYPTVPLTNAAGDDAGTFLPPGTDLPAFCSALNQGNGAVVVNIPQVAGEQVGLVRFRARVNPPPAP